MVRSGFAKALLAALFVLASACGTNDTPNGSGGSGGDGVAGSGGGAGGEGGTAGEGGEGGEGGTEEPEPVIDVDGTVIDEEGRPISNAAVVLDGDYRNAIKTGVDGAFSLKDVSPPYDLTVVAGSKVYELRGLTRQDPLVPAASDWTVERKANVSGTIGESVVFPLPQGDAIALALVGSHRSIESADTGAFSGQVSWFGSDEITTDLLAAHLRLSSMGGLELLGTAGVPNLSLTSGGQHDDLAMALHPVEDLNQETEVRIDYGAYTTFGSARIAWFELFDLRLPVQLGGIVSGHSIRTPPSAAISVRASDAKDNRVARVVPAVVDGVTAIDLPAQPALEAVEPAEGATDVSVTPTLSWTAVPGAKAYWVSVGLMQFVLPADETRLEVPDYGSLFSGLIPGEGTSWQVTAFLDEGFGSDDVADGSGMGMAKTLIADELTMYQSALTFFLTEP